jgi:3-oxoacyl-[acyl-carrier protein] reductase
MPNRLIIISGANGQIGSYLAERYATQSDTNLLLLYHKRQDRLANLLNLPNVTAETHDLHNYDNLNILIDTYLNKYIRTEICLIHTAAVRSSDAAPLSDSDPEIWNRVFDANLKSSYNLLRAVLPAMRERGFGRIVLMGSNITRTGLVNGSAYAAAKAALANLAITVSKENADRNILVNVISPAPVDTDLAQDYSGEYLDFRIKYFEEHKKRVPTGKLVTKAEIALVCDLLLSNQISNLCGQEIIIDGGIS